MRSEIDDGVLVVGKIDARIDLPLHLRIGGEDGVDAAAGQDVDQVARAAWGAGPSAREAHRAGEDRRTDGANGTEKSSSRDHFAGSGLRTKSRDTINWMHAATSSLL